MKSKAVGIIPARYASTRFPGKPLAMIAGKTMIQRVYENSAKAINLDKVIVATDDDRIFSEVESFGGLAIMTNPDLPSGSDRIYQAYQKMELDYDTVVNIQGDEPLINSQDLDNLVIELDKSIADVATLIKRIDDANELADPSKIKVVRDNQNYAMYFSRFPIPFSRDVDANLQIPFFKHIGVYAYRINALQKFVSLDKSPLERAESLEQLRLMQAGYKYLCIETNNETIGVDTADDLSRIEKLFT